MERCIFYYYFFYYYEHNNFTINLFQAPKIILYTMIMIKSEKNERGLGRQEIPAKHLCRKYENDSSNSKFWQFDSLNSSKLDKKRVKEGSERYDYRISFLFPTKASFSLTWNHTPFLFLLVNNIPAGKPDCIRENWLHMRTAKIGPDLRLPFLLSCASNFRFRTLFSL